MGKLFLGFIVAVILGFAAFTWFTLSWSYSEGERAGLLQKFSRRGWVCKTYEGEMVLATVATVNAEKFTFSVRDEEIAKQLTADIGQHVTVHYEQHKWIPTSCFGDTQYFVTSVQLTALPQAAPAQAPTQPPPPSPPAQPPTQPPTQQ